MAGPIENFSHQASTGSFPVPFLVLLAPNHFLRKNSLLMVDAALSMWELLRVRTYHCQRVCYAKSKRVSVLIHQSLADYIAFSSVLTNHFAQIFPQAPIALM
jgi:hypothetical protein